MLCCRHWRGAAVRTARGARRSSVSSTLLKYLPFLGYSVDLSCWVGVDRREHSQETERRRAKGTSAKKKKTATRQDEAQKTLKTSRVVKKAERRSRRWTKRIARIRFFGSPDPLLCFSAEGRKTRKALWAPMPLPCSLEVTGTGLPFWLHAAARRKRAYGSDGATNTSRPQQEELDKNSMTEKETAAMVESRPTHSQCKAPVPDPINSVAELLLTPLIGVRGSSSSFAIQSPH